MRRRDILFGCLMILVGLNIFGFVQAAAPYPTFPKNFVPIIKPVVSDPKVANLFEVQVSGVGLQSFESRGIYGYLSDSSVIYYADFALQLQCNILSKFTVTSTGARVVKDPTEWGSFYMYPDWADMTTAYTDHRIADIPYITQTITEGYLSGLDIAMDYIPIETKLLTFQGVNVTASVPHTEVTFDSLYVNSVTLEEIGQYSSYIGGTPTDIRADSIVIDGTYLPASMGGDAKETLADEVNTLQLGIKPVGSPTQETLQQLVTNPSPRGTTVYPETDANNHANFILPCQLNPEVTAFNQLYKIRSASMTIDTRNEWYWPNAGIVYTSAVAEDSPSYRSNVQFRNFNYKYDIAISGRVFGTSEFSVPLSQAVIDDPEFQAGDYYWDMTITGGTGIDVAFLQAGNPLQGAFENWVSYINENIWLIMGIVGSLGVAVIIVLVMYLVIKKGASKAMSPT